MDLFTAAKTKIKDDKQHCAPLAVSLVTGVPFNKVRARMEAHGRRRRCGTPRWITFQVLSDLGFEYRMLDDLPLRCKTVSSLGKALSRRKLSRFLVFTRNHALAVVDGKVQDWTANRRHRVKFVFLVEK